MKNLLFILTLFSISVSAQDTNTVWVYCAAEDEICYLPTTNNYIVRYGAEIAHDGEPGVWVIQTHTQSVPCDNATFGDPLYLTVKDCWYTDEEPEPEPEPEVPPQAGTIDWNECSAHEFSLDEGTSLACPPNTALVIFECQFFSLFQEGGCTITDVNGNANGLRAGLADVYGSMKCCKVN